MVRPVAANIPVSFPYGVRYKNGVIHKGVDFSIGTEGHPIYSIADATVVHVGYGGWGPAYGNHLICTTTFKGKKKWILYGHMKQIDVKVGQKLKAGQKVGLNGGGVGHRYSGNSTGPHVHVQVGHANSYLSYEDPWPLINFDPTPVLKGPRPPFWFGIDWRNFSGFDVVHGKATFDTRLPLIIKDIHAVNRTFVCAVEIPNGKVPAVVAAMAKIGYDHLAGDLGRHIFAHKGITADAENMFDLKPRYRGDTKQGVGVIAKPTDGYAVGICTAQLENEDASGDTQVGQADNLVDKFEAWCDAHEIDESRRFYALDTNSDNRVRSEVFQARGYVDAFDVAWSSENSIWRSLVKWFGKPTKGKRIDLIAVRKGRPVRRARLRTQTSNLNDHLDMFVDVGSL
jgi:hypothetical protein